jgi:Polyketide cyclase / dehydrase and lipid transport
VIVVHRLLKNQVAGSGYVLMTEAFAASYGLNPEQLGLSPHVEGYGDVGEVRCFVGELERRYREERDRRRLAVTPDEAALQVERFLPLAPAAAWELLTAPGKRLLWQVDDIEEAQAGGRRCTGTASVCVDGRTKIYEEILDWRPFEYFTESRTPAGGARFLLTTTLTPAEGGTVVRALGRPDGGRARPFAARRLARRIRGDYERLAALASPGRED